MIYICSNKKDILRTFIGKACLPAYFIDIDQISICEANLSILLKPTKSWLAT